MSYKSFLATVAFILVSALDILAVVTCNKQLEIIFKPLLMISLLVMYLALTKKRNHWFIIGLFFSFLGDVFLLGNKKFLIFGLSFFLVVHFLYIRIAFSLMIKPILFKIIIFIIPFLFVFFNIFHLIREALTDLVIPVIFYGVTIATLGGITLFNYVQQNNNKNKYLFLGVILFMASDALIALNTFYSSLYLFDVLIIILYLIAQYLICKGVIKIHS